MPHDTLCLSTPAVSDALAALRPASLSLADLPLGSTAHVLAVRAGQHAHERELTQRLLEIGFIEGEPVRVIAHGQPGREPIAVRVGGTTFALRRFEAERVLVSAPSRAAVSR